MALGTQFQQIIEMVRDEARLSSATSRGIDHLAHIKRLIVRHYNMLSDGFDWEHLRVKRNDSRVTLGAAQRYSDFPAQIDPEAIQEVFVYAGSTWQPLAYGIRPDDLNANNSDNGNRTSWPDRWDFYGDNQFEVWPVPAGGGVQIGFEGRKKVQALIQDTDRADIDDELIALHVAAEILIENGQKDAGTLKMQAANARLAQAKANRSDKTRIRMGMGRIGSGAFPRRITHIRA